MSLISLFPSLRSEKKMNVIGDTDEEDGVIIMERKRPNSYSPPKKDEQPQKQQKKNSSSSSSSSSSSTSSSSSGVNILKLRGVSNCFDHDEEVHPSEEFTAKAKEIEQAFALEMADARDLAVELRRMRLAAALPIMMHHQAPHAEPLTMPQDGDFGVNQLFPGDPQHDLVHRKFLEGMSVNGTVGIGIPVKNVKIYEVEAIKSAVDKFEASKKRISASHQNDCLLWHGTTQQPACKFGRPGEDLAGPCSGGTSTDKRCNVCSIARVSFQQGKVCPRQIPYQPDAV